MDRLISENMAWHYTKLAMPLSERAKLKKAFELIPNANVEFEVSKRMERKIKVEAYREFYNKLVSDINDLNCWMDGSILAVSKDQVFEVLDAIMEDITLKGE